MIYLGVCVWKRGATLQRMFCVLEASCIVCLVCVCVCVCLVCVTVSSTSVCVWKGNYFASNGLDKCFMFMHFEYMLSLCMYMDTNVSTLREISEAH